MSDILANLQAVRQRIATAQQARAISKIGVFYDTAEETLAANGFAPNRNGGNQGFLRKTA